MCRRLAPSADGRMHGARRRSAGRVRTAGLARAGLLACALLARPAEVACGDPAIALAATAHAGGGGLPEIAPPPCRCDRFTEEIAAAEALFASRGDGVEFPPDTQAAVRFRARVDESYARATCLAACDATPDAERNRARVLLAFAAFKTAGLPKEHARARLTAAADAAERCLATEPENRGCLLWHASARGVLAGDSWNPLNLRLPSGLLREFRAARGGRPPGEDLLDGAATRGEASLLLRVPGFAGGDPVAARNLLEAAAAAPRFACAVSNRLLLAEARARTGAMDDAVVELRATVTAGLPSCTLQRYENALTLEEARRCLHRLEAEPAADPGWKDDCR